VLDNIVSRSGPYTGDDSQTTFAYAFRIRAATDLRVTTQLIASPSVDTVLTYPTDYTVTGVGNKNGGNIVLTFALASTKKMLIRRVRPLTQEQDISNQGPFHAETHEHAFDHDVMLAQQLKDDLARTPKFTDTTDIATFDPTLPPPVAGAAYKVNGAVTGMEAYDPASSLPSAVNLPGGNGILVKDGTSTLQARTIVAGEDLAVTNGTGVSGNPTVALNSPGYLGELRNLALKVTVVGANSWEVELMNFAGVLPSDSEASVVFRNDTASSGRSSRVKYGNLADFTLSNGSTLGMQSGVDEYLYWYVGLESASQFRLLVSKKLFDEGSLQSASAEGGAGAADSATTLYADGSLTLSNKPIRLIGRMKVNQTVAGVHANAPTEISMVPFEKLNVDFLTAEGSPALTDYVPFRDVSAIAERKGLLHDVLALSRVRNFVENAEGRFFQRQAAATLTSRQDDQYADDRWYVLTSGGAVNVQCARVAEVIASSPTPYVVQCRQADGTARQFGRAQIIEYDKAVALRGKQVTFAFWARTDTTEVPNIRMGIVEWTGTADAVTSDIVSSWAATPTLIANSAFINTPADLALTATMQQFQVTVTLGSTFNNLVLFVWTPAAEAQNDDFYMTQVQLVEWPEALPWNLIRKPFDVDLQECRMRVRKSYGVDIAPGTVTDLTAIRWTRSGGNAVNSVQWDQPMAGVPAVTFYNPVTGTAGEARNYSASTNIASTASDPGQSGFSIATGLGSDGDAAYVHYTAIIDL
jgi:hypothetical protein